ncbi:hypothetical protein D6D05_05114 [Aureobasidium pullulans]|nr:hypothetical protein D6D05_05114 [Aureobasidium pullulans]
MPPRVCFAPDDHPDGSHNHFQDNPFGHENIWIGYCDEPTQAFCGFISLQALVEEVQHNFAHGYKDRFPFYLISFGGRYGHAVSSDEELRYNAQCSACTTKKQCDHSLVQYLPVEVWDYARGRPTKIFLCTLMITIKNKPMLALLKHRGQGSFGFQYTDGSISKSMNVNFVAVDNETHDAIGTDDFGDKNKTDANAIDHRTLPQKITSDYFTKSRARGIVIDLTPDDEEDELPLKKEERFDSPPELTVEPMKNQINSEDADNYMPTAIMKEFGRMMANMARDFGIDALSQPEARRLRSRMGEAAKLGNKEMLYHYFGLLSAAVFDHA